METTRALSGAHCPGCNYRFSVWEASGIDGRVWACPGCGLDWTEFEMDCKPSEERLLDNSIARDNRWYHATQRRNWLRDVCSDERPVYVGSELAALIRSQHLVSERRTHGGMWWIYELSLAGNTEIQAGLRIDNEDHDWIEDTYDMEVEFGEPVDAARYLNRYEDIGSISLLIDPAYVRVERVRAYDNVGLRRRMEQLVGPAV